MATDHAHVLNTGHWSASDYDFQNDDILAIAAAPAVDMPFPVVGFCGLAGSGKSTTADALMSLDPKFTRVKFADVLKAMLREALTFAGLSEEEANRRIEGDLKEAPCPPLMGASPRHAMQTLGGEWGRGLIHPDFWVNLWERRAQRMLDAGLKVVVDDVRHPNEVTAVRRLGGIVVELHGRGGIAPAHESEGQRLDVDLRLLNEGTVEELRDALRHLPTAHASL